MKLRLKNYKKNNMNRLHSWKICAAMVALLLATACSQDELPEQGTPLPAGQYPLELTVGELEAVATPAQPATRSTFFEGDWDGVTGVRVRVNDQQEKEYSVTPSDDKKTARLIPAQPLESTDELFWWTNTENEKTITAWAPSEYVLDKTIEFPAEWKREDFAKYDIIGANKTIKFTDPNKSLEFQHLMAKFVINLRKTPYLENAENVKVQLYSQLWCYGIMKISSGQLKISSYTSTIEGEVREYTTPYHLPEEEYEEVDFGDGLPEKPFASYTALVPPLNGRVSPLLIIEVDGVKYQLLQNNFTEDYIVSYRAGQVYTFNVTVKESGLNVTVEESIGWGTGNNGEGSVTLPTEITLSDKPVEIKDNGNYIITGDGTQTVTIDGNAHVTFSNVNITTTEGAPIHVTGGSPTLHFNEENTLECQSGYWGGIAVENDADITLKGGTENAKLTIINSNSDNNANTVGIGTPVKDPQNPGSTCGNIIISNLYLTINSSMGSGIGATHHSVCGDIEITDCKLNITTVNNAACIGASCGSYDAKSQCGSITLRNCEIESLDAVYAFGYNDHLNPAAIGCSTGNAHCGDINIYLHETYAGINDFLTRLIVYRNVDKVGTGNEWLGKTPTTGTITWYDHNEVKIGEGTGK